MLPYSLIIKFGFVAVLVIIVSFFYIDYKRLQNQTIELSKQIENSRSEIILQQEQILALENSFEKQKQIRQSLDKEIKTITKEISGLEEKVLKHDIAYLASKKPVLIEKAINNGTQEIIRCIELATGSEANPDEKNKTCPSLLTAD